MPDPSCAKLCQWWDSNILKVTVFSQLLSLLYGISNLLLPRASYSIFFFLFSLFLFFLHFSLILSFLLFSFSFFLKVRIKAFLSPLFSSPKTKYAEHVLITEHRLIVLIFHSRELGSFSSSALLLSKECEKSFLESLVSGQGFLASAWNKTSILKCSIYFLPRK